MKGNNHKENCECKWCSGKAGFQKGNIIFKGKNNPMFGKKRNCPWITKRNKKQIKNKNPFFGKHHTKESKEKAFQTKIKNGTYCKFNWTTKFYPDLNIHFKSTWEANIARIFNYLNIKWDYEPAIFDLNGIKYCPDFYLSEFNIFVEVKGYMYNHSQNKINKFKEKYPLEVIGPTEYKEWINDFGKNINKLKGESQ